MSVAAVNLEEQQSFTLADGETISTPVLKAKDSGGLKLYDDGGTKGLFISDDGYLGIGTTTPIVDFDLIDSAYNRKLLFRQGNGAYTYVWGASSSTYLASANAGIAFAPSSSRNKLFMKSSTYQNFINLSGNGFRFQTSTEKTLFEIAATYQVIAGYGCREQISLPVNLAQSDITFRRDVDGGSTKSEAGTLLRLERNVANVTSEGGYFFEWNNGSTLGYINKNGNIVIGNQTAPGSSPADAAQLYAADWNGAGTSTLFARNEEGHIFKLAQSAHIADTTDDLSAHTTVINGILSALRQVGILASS